MCGGGGRGRGRGGEKRRMASCKMATSHTLGGGGAGGVVWGSGILAITLYILAVILDMWGGKLLAGNFYM